MASTTDPSSGTSTVRGYISDLIAVARHVRGAIDQQLSGSSLINVAGADKVLRQAAAALKAGQTELENRLRETGGLGVATHLKEAATSVTGFLTGIYGQVRGETTSRALRDDHTGLNFVVVCASMLDTTARALGDLDTARVTEALMQGLTGPIMEVGVLIPRSVVNDLAVEGHPVQAAAAERSIAAVRAAWLGAGGRADA